MNKGLLFFAFVLLGTLSYAQNTRTAETPKPARPQYQSVKKEKKGLFTKKKKVKTSTNESEVAAFRARINKVYKEKAKEEKKADKKRYKEHGYFGHKKPPKKRPPGKQKFCKVCKIKH